VGFVSPLLARLYPVRLVRLKDAHSAGGEIVRGKDGRAVLCAPYAACFGAPRSLEWRIRSACLRGSASAQSATHAFLPPPTCRNDRGEAGELLGLVNQADATRNFAGYTDVAATRRKLVRDVLRRGDCWFRTGDLLRTDADGFVYFVDRLGDTFRYKGENVSTAEVAAAIGAIASLRLAQCLVYGVQVLLTTPSPVGCVCPSPPPMDMPRLRRAGAACRWARRHGRAAPRGGRRRQWQRQRRW